MLFLFITLLLAHLLSSDAEAQKYRLPIHSHQANMLARHAAEADRFMGMLSLSQCDEKTAKLWLLRSLAHDPKNASTKDTLKLVDTWPKEESQRAMQKAEQNGGDLRGYIRAYQCDPDNTKALEAISRMILDRNGSSVEIRFKR